MNRIEARWTTEVEAKDAETWLANSLEILNLQNDSLEDVQKRASDLGVDILLETRHRIG